MSEAEKAREVAERAFVEWRDQDTWDWRPVVIAALLQFRDDEVERWKQSYARECKALMDAGATSFGTVTEGIAKLRRDTIEECARVAWKQGVDEQAIAAIRKLAEEG